MYNPTTGRFNRLDEFAGNFREPQSLHKYAYVHGDPVNGADPTGWFVALVSIGISTSANTSKSQSDVTRGVAATQTIRFLGFQANWKTFVALVSAGGVGIAEILRPVAQEQRRRHHELEKLRTTLDRLRGGDEELLEELEDERISADRARRWGLIEPWEANGNIPIFVESIRELGKVAITDFEAQYSHGHSVLLSFHNAGKRIENIFRREAQAPWRNAHPGYQLAARGETLEEYPFASTVQGGLAAHVDVVPEHLNSRQGGKITQFKARHPELNRIGNVFLVLITP